ncbi:MULTISPECIES: hypothetical protein [unclassified Nocardioides]|uniref:hypothetical protein n=1 Tax=unclassified Nocardioides TaxID=2615069 RepID=UPI001E5F3BFD|nr:MULTISPECIES: hypothetical protein [unclassified Nocardioides]MCD4524109.1 hypothetical protein [Nocardioides sp. cx-173]MCD4533463.1 hypothetical protein [Nocardioides sp. cx-169]UGB41506.1 hypothetical protein LQ940_19350 [Nocardioides sp. cx-173]
MLKFLLVVAIFAVAVYLVTRLAQQRGAGTRPTLPRRRPPAAPPRVIGPDDDEDFLRDLDRKRRHPEDPDA